MNNPKYIVIHHSATEDGRTLDLQHIRISHIENKWLDIAYHFVVEYVQGGFEVVMGRFPNQYGAHSGVIAINESSIGVCLIGNFQKYSPPPGQWNKAVRLCRYLCDVYKIEEENIKGHRDFKPTLCPGDKFNMGQFRQDVKEFKFEF
jgi:N-acetyl-anhydromuramyl-L-alanine amidase AmpD